MLLGDGVRKKGKGWTVRWVDAHGKRQERTVYVRTRAEAREKRAQLMAKTVEQRLGIYGGDAEATLGDVWELYEPIARTKDNWRVIEIHWRRHLEPEFGDKRLRAVSKNDVLRFLAKKSASLSPRTLEHLRVRLGALYKFAAGEGTYKGENPAAAVGALSVPEKEPRTLEWQHVQAVIDNVESDWRNLFALAVYTGLRAGELRGLKRGDVDKAWRYLSVRRSGARITTKTSKERKVVLPAAALPYLKAALDISVGREWLFTDRRGNQLSKNVKLPGLLREALERAGLVESWTGWCHRGCRTRESLGARCIIWRCPKCSRPGKVEPNHELVFHDLRKTWETALHEVVSDPMAVFQMAGHSPEVAMRRYLSRNVQRLGTLADRLDFNEPSPSYPRDRAETGRELPGTAGIERNETK